MAITYILNTVWHGSIKALVAISDRTLAGMQRGVRESVTFLILLTGRHETKGRPDKDGEYEGVFTRRFCNEEMKTARAEGLHIIGVIETDERYGKPDIDAERSRAMTGGSNGGPVHEEARENSALLDEVCFIPLRRERHEVPGYLNEIIAEGIATPEEEEPPEEEGGEDESFEVHEDAEAAALVP